MVDFKADERLNTLNHSCAHVMAQAVKHLYPEAKFWVGPVVKEGFYYDIDLGENAVNDDVIAAIEKEMKKICKEGKKIYRREISKAEALELFKNDEYKLDLISDLEDGTISVYDQGDFTDLCRGPHVDNTKLCKNFKLVKYSGVYWKGDANNHVMQRIYGVCFPTAEELEAHLKLLEEAKERDHRKIGKEMQLFMSDDLVGRGLPMFLPKGYTVWQELENYIKAKERKLGYLHVMTPCVGTVGLYKTSGHWDHYKENMFPAMEMEGESFVLRPMNCPHHCEIYRSKPRSYKELPVRLAEFGTVYRYEQSGELHGLTRVRGFTQDDAHLFVRPDQLLEEFERVIDIVLYIFKTLKFDNYTAQISLRDPNNKEKYIGSDENWEKAESAIMQAAKEKGLTTVVELGEAAFYGPKLDFMVKDAIGRKWQLGTIQVDYNLPERFDLTYKGADDRLHRPIMIHRAPFGSMERFVAVLLEHTGGKFPLWLSPQQVVVLPISEKFNDYAQKVSEFLNRSDVRTEVDDRNEKIGRKIRDNELKRIPYLLIVGEKEEAEGLVSVRAQGEGDKGQMSLEAFRDFIAGLVKEEIEANKLEKK